MTMATGDPIVSPPRIPPTICASSCSIFIRAPRPYPCCRRARSPLIRCRSSRTPAGMPFTIIVSCGPWDSPAVLKVNLLNIHPERSEGSPVAQRSASHQQIVELHAEIKPIGVVSLYQCDLFCAIQAFQVSLTRFGELERVGWFKIDKAIVVVPCSE